MYKILKRLFYLLKKVFGSKAFKFALEKGLFIWSQVNFEFKGTLSKEKYQTKAGAWKKGGEAAYELEKRKRQDKWFELLRPLVLDAFPKIKSLTSLLFMIHGMVGTEIKKKAVDLALELAKQKAVEAEKIRKDAEKAKEEEKVAAEKERNAKEAKKLEDKKTKKEETE